MQKAATEIQVAEEEIVVSQEEIISMEVEEETGKQEGREEEVESDNAP